FLTQIPLNSNGVASVTNSFESGSLAISAHYVSDTAFASSSGSLLGTAPDLTVLMNSEGALQLEFTNVLGAPFVVLGSTDILLPLTNWTSLGRAEEIS